MEIKEAVAAGERWGARRRGEGEAPGLPRAGGSGWTLRGRAGRWWWGARRGVVSGCRGHLASPLPFRQGAAGEESPGWVAAG